MFFPRSSEALRLMKEYGSLILQPQNLKQVKTTHLTFCEVFFCLIQVAPPVYV